MSRMAQAEAAVSAAECSVFPTSLFTQESLPALHEELDRFAEECAVFGVYLPQDQRAALLTYFALFNLQHRGQDASGMAVSDGEHTMKVHKNLGLVAQVHTQRKLERMIGHIGIGHNRYTTFGSNKLSFVQPIIEGKKRKSGKSNTKELAIALNGNISNPEPMSKFLQEKGVDIVNRNDTMLMSALLWYFLQETNDIVAAIEQCWPYWIGAFSLVILWKDKLVGVRGPYGVRPLMLGQFDEGGYALSSETCAWNSVGKLVRPIEPGEVVVITSKGITSQQIMTYVEKPDAFEAVYFARPDSIFTCRLADGTLFKRSIYQIRRNFGEQLWKEHRVKADMVVPVPASAHQTAEKYAQDSGIPYYNALIKSPYIHRTFIQPSQKERDLSHSFKLNVAEDQVEGKTIVLIDDSIVRGTTLGPLIIKFKKAGAKAVYVMIASPPVKFPDFYGIATPSQTELIGAHKTPAEIAAQIGADGVYYLSFQGMLDAIGLSKANLMTSAFDGDYPIDIGENRNKLFSYKKPKN